MRLISKGMIAPALVVLTILCFARVHGQQAGFVRLLNTVHVGAGPMRVAIDGKPVRDEGYQPDDLTGGIAVVPGGHVVSFERVGLVKGAARVTVRPDETTILIPFAERVPATADRPEQWGIRILRLKQHDPENKRSATFVSVSAEPETRIEVMRSGGDWEPVDVRRLGLTRIGIKQSKGYLPVRSNGRLLTEISVSPAGNHVLVLYDDVRGVMRSRAFGDHKYLGAE